MNVRLFSAYGYFARCQLPVCLPAAHSASLTSSPRIPPPNVALQPSWAMVVVFSFLILMLMPCCMFPNVLVPPCKPVVAKKGILLALAYCTCFAGKPNVRVRQKQRLTVLMTSFSVATSTTTAKIGGSCSLSLSVATRNSAEPGKTIAAPGDN